MRLNNLIQGRTAKNGGGKGKSKNRLENVQVVIQATWSCNQSMSDAQDND